MSAATDFATALQQLAKALDQAKAKWYLFGAQAVGFWARPRTTDDVDVTVDLPLAQADQLLRVLGRSGFDPRPMDPPESDRLESLARTRVLPVVHRDSGTPVDLVFAGPGLELMFLARAHWVDLAGVAIPVISPEDLIVTKILAGRPKDLEDARSVLKARRDSLDLEPVRELLHLLEQALDRRDLLPELERALAGIDR